MQTSSPSKNMCSARSVRTCISSEKNCVPKSIMARGPATRSRGIRWPWSACIAARCLGVYEILESDLGVRWLWPGELGTYVPRRSTIVLAARDKTVKPRLVYRNLGGWDLPQIFLTGSYFGRKVRPNYRVGGLSEEVVRKLVFPTEEAGYSYGRAVEIYNRRHRRVTQIEEPRAVLGSHVIAGITDWWAQFGKEHPEWFALCGGRETGSQGAAGWCLDSVVRFQSRDAAIPRRAGLGRRRRFDIGGDRRGRRKHVPLSPLPGLGRPAGPGVSGRLAAPEIHATCHGRSLCPLSGRRSTTWPSNEIPM